MPCHRLLLAAALSALASLTLSPPVRARQADAPAARPLRLVVAGLAHGHVYGFRRQAARAPVEIVGVYDPDAGLLARKLTAAGLGALLVPYPHAAHDHQVVNAANLVDRGAAAMIPDRELNGERLAKEIAHWLSDRQALSRMSANARTFARPDAAERIVRSLERWSRGRAAARGAASAGETGD